MWWRGRLGPASAAVLFVVLAIVTNTVDADDDRDTNVAASREDFAPENGEWNGLSSLVALAEENGVQLEVVRHLDVGTLQPTDSLLLIGPRHELPAGALTSLMRAGARVALADDFGAGNSLLRAFSIGRGRPSENDALQLRGNPELLVARPTSTHPLSLGVGALVTNHPQVVYHRELEPIFSFGERDAVVLAGAVGSGRLVAIADPSVLINNMLALGGNRRFAGNLLAYLAGEGGGRVILAPPDAVVVGRFGEPGADRPLHDVRAMLEQLARADLPPSALRILAAALAGVMLVLAAGVLPRRSPYSGASQLARPAVPGGFAGRVGWFGARPQNLGDPTMVYKLELETELHGLLGLGYTSSVDEVVTRMKANGMPETDVSEARALLSELATLRGEWEARGDVLPEARFRRIVRSGDALLVRAREATTRGARA